MSDEDEIALSPEQIEPIREQIALVLLPVGVFCLSLAAISIKLSEQELGPNATIFNRFWIATVALVLWNGISSRIYRRCKSLSVPTKTYTIRDLGLFLAAAIVGSSNLVFWAWSLTQTTVANSNLLHNITPVFAALGGWLFLGHCFDGKFMIGMVLALGGAILIGTEDWQIAADNFRGDTLALLSSVLYAVHTLIIEQLRVKFPTTTILLWSCLLRSLLTLPVALMAEDRLFPSSLSGWLAVITLAILCQTIGQGILIYSLNKFSSGFVTLFLLLEPIITTLLAWKIFSERLSILNWVAFFIVLVGIYLAKSGRSSKK